MELVSHSASSFRLKMGSEHEHDFWGEEARYSAISK
jgi:hypothetical protein